MKQLTHWAACAAVTLWIAPAFAQSADDVVGRWYTEDRQSQVEISKESAGGKTVYGGKLVWFDEPVYEEGDPEEGKALRDRENPDESLQNVPLLGLKMLLNFTYDADAKEWNGGTIYDPERGKTYKCVMKLGENDTLDVRGYIGIPALGRTTVWEKVTEENDLKTD